MERQTLRGTFTTVAELYHRARPGYPSDAFDEIARAAPGKRVLEIGPGTGQATRPLAERGFVITGVEIGADMVTVARRVLADLPNVRIEHAAFEDWPLPAEPFDVVLSAT